MLFKIYFKLRCSKTMRRKGTSNTLKKLFQFYHRVNIKQVIVINHRNRLQLITLFHVIVIDYIEENLDVFVIIIEYFDKNLDVIDYIELALKRGNPICDVTCCRLYS